MIITALINKIISKTIKIETYENSDIAFDDFKSKVEPIRHHKFGFREIYIVL